MTGRLAIDFGNANTVIAIWDDQEEEAKPIQLAPYSRLQPWQNENIPIIPSLIHYRPDGSMLIGNEVLQANLATHEHTFIALKTSFDTIHAISVGNQKISARKAAEDFLSAILKKATNALSLRKDEPLALSVPVDAFERYSKWLADVCTKNGLPNVRFIDEPAAAALSFRRTVRQNDDYLIFDFGAGSLDVAVVRFNFEKQVKWSSHCKVLGKRSMQFGGNNIDQWLVERFLATHKIAADSDQAKKLKWILANECRAAKEKLSFQDEAELAVSDYQTGKTLTLKLTRDDFISILEEHDFFVKVDRTIRNAEQHAQYESWFKREKLAGVFMVGGTSIIPELQKHLRRTFGKDRVQVSRPLDSIASGAVAFAAGATLYDHIQHDYAIEVHNLQNKKVQMKLVVQRGEKYPSKGPIASEVVKAVTFGQTKFQIFIYEISKEEVEPGTEFIDLAHVTEKDDQVLRYVCLNKAHPTLLQTNRPIMHSHPALQIDFRIDENKHLIIDTYRFETDQVKVQDMKDVIVVRLA